MKKALIVDGSSLGSRAYYIKENPFEFFNMVAAVVQDTDPEYLVFAFDNGEPDPRRDLYPDYKAGRNKEDGETRHRFIDMLRGALSQAGFATLSHSEGDDVVGTVALKAYQQGIFSYTISGDTDLMALVNDGNRAIWYGRYFYNRKLYNAAAVESKIGVPPHLIYDYVGLAGEASDNIPGVQGIGPQGAVRMLRELGNLYEVLEFGPQVEEFRRYHKALREGREMAELSYTLACIRQDLPLDFDFSGCTSVEMRARMSKAVSYFKVMMEAYVNGV